MERRTICFPRYGTRDVVQYGDANFKDAIDRYYSAPESDALEALIDLKTHLQTLPTDDFWSAVTHGISSIVGADMSFVMKRVLVDDHDVAVEMPRLGEPGACLMAAAFHYCSKDGAKTTVKGTKFSAWSCPCAYMRHDKVFVIPEGLDEFIVDNPNHLPVPADAYIAVPLFAEGKCFAHFGAMWSKEMAAQRKLSWAFIEMLLHSLEDMIQDRLHQGARFAQPTLGAGPQERPRVIPHDEVTASQSLRPYAGSLSHELRTPMQGIVGMLDVMYATVLEAVEKQNDPKLQKLFENLKENIEVVQDSSRRAVEAADNVVHAYDMDMSIPDAPSFRFDDPEAASPFPAGPSERRPEILVAGYDLPLSRPNKRRRDEAFSRQNSSSDSNKLQKVEDVCSVWCRAAEPSREVKDGLFEAKEVQAHAQPGATPADAPTSEDTELAMGAVHPSNRIIAPGLRHTNMREVFQFVINEGLKMGGRPEQALATETLHGESIEVRSRGSNGTAKTKIVEWSVDPNVPNTMFIDEKDLSKLISCVFLNAIKFTDQSGGRVSVYARMSLGGRYISIKITDNGPGIPATFLPKLFQPFSRENVSTTRQSEGLGLGLMVAKGLARKLGGDLMCTRAISEGPDHGTEFEIKVPVIAGETITRPSSPFSSPVPARANLNANPTSPNGRVQPPLLFSPELIPPNPVKVSSTPQVRGYDTPQSHSHRSATPPSPRTSTSQFAIPEIPPPIATSSPFSSPNGTVPSRPRIRESVSTPRIDRDLATKYPLTFLVAEDNKINRKLLVSMLAKFGYKTIHEAHDGAEAVRQMSIPRQGRDRIDVVLMDLWMPLMDGYEATERILGMHQPARQHPSSNGVAAAAAAAVACKPRPTVLAVTADCTDAALERAAQVGMTGFMTKPYKLHDLQRLITEYCAWSKAEVVDEMPRASA